MREPEASGWSIPRWMALVLAPFIWLVAIPLVHGIVPWEISRLTRRYGWTAGQPALWNLLGLAPILAGAALLLWVFLFGMTLVHEMPPRVTLNWKPKLLIARGPYAFTRNPMYLGEQLLWIGWTILFGSPALSIGCIVMWIGINVVARREERDLAAAYGEAYERYKTAVPRWL